MKRFLAIIFITTLSLTAVCAQPLGTQRVVLQTTMGNITLLLYDLTPIHRDNFIRLVKEGFYDGLLFHRVIPNFMIQGGDAGSRDADSTAMLGDTPESYSIPAEIRFPQLFHKKGVLAAAREGDDINPERASSSSQFYIVVGRVMNDAQLDRTQARVSLATDGKAVFTPEIREVYKTVGGTPHLDGQYTVFGEVLDGMEVVEAIQHVATNEQDRPLNDVRIIKASLVE